MKPSLRFLATLLSTVLIWQSFAAAHPQLLTVTHQKLEKREGRKGDHKYFHEPGSDDIKGHYDTRYYHGVVSYEERTDTLTHMIRAYLITFRKLGLETWISHGTLLGWWWNGKILPWDWDLDTQVSGDTLNYMGKHHNRTTHKYVSEDKTFKRSYLLDVNPWIWERERGDGQNVIDARWIDTTNGLYIDITGLSETHPDVQPGVWACKNYHRYRTRDLYPMRESFFEGVPALIPYAYDRMLIEEYGGKSLVVETFHDHNWDPILQEWVRDEKAEAETKRKEEERRKQDEKKKEKEKAEKKKKEKEKAEKKKKEKEAKQKNE